MVSTRWVFAACLAMLAVACSSATATTVSAHGPLTATLASRSTGPTVTVTPDTALIGGQPLKVRLTGFPPHVGVEIYECVAGHDCDPGASTSFASTGFASTGFASTGDAGSATMSFDAQPSVLVGSDATPTRCGRQCVLVAVAVKPEGRPIPKPTPTATEALAFSAAAGATDLAYSSLLSTSWISATQGWALAAQPCDTGTCTRLARTTDGGRRWQVLPDPPAGIAEATTDCTVGACVSQVSFANSRIGYLYGPALLMTTDGGLTWHAKRGLQTGTLTIAGRHVYRGAFTSDGCPGPCQPSLLEATVGSTHWRTIIAKIAEPDSGDFGQIAVSGTDVLIDMTGDTARPFPAHAIVYRSTNGGATWSRQSADPCSGRGPGGSTQEDDLTSLAAAPGDFFVGLCYQRKSMRTFVITSTDAGAAWHATAATPPGETADLVAATGHDTIIVGSWPSRLLATTDDGKQWDVAATNTHDVGWIGFGVQPWIGFETPLAGQWLGDPHGLWHTTDGGLRWTRTAFR